MEGCFNTTYLGPNQVEKHNSESVVIALKTFFVHNKFDMKNLVVVDTNSKSVMARINNGAYAKLKKDAHSLIKIKFD